MRIIAYTHKINNNNNNNNNRLKCVQERSREVLKI